MVAQKFMSVRSIDFITFAITSSVLDKTSVNTISAHSQDAKDETELKAMVKKAALVVNDHSTLKVPEGAVDYDFQFDMTVIDFHKNLENLHSIMGDENVHDLTIELERLPDKQQWTNNYMTMVL